MENEECVRCFLSGNRTFGGSTRTSHCATTTGRVLAAGGQRAGRGTSQVDRHEPPDALKLRERQATQACTTTWPPFEPSTRAHSPCCVRQHMNILHMLTQYGPKWIPTQDRKQLRVARGKKQAKKCTRARAVGGLQPQGGSPPPARY